jgi:hypothetical protein
MNRACAMTVHMDLALPSCDVDLCTAEWGGAELADVERLSRFAKYREMAFSYLSDVLGVKTAAV